MTLFKSSFPTLDQQACATRMIDTWDEDICSSCILPSFFAHECDPNDSSGIAHVPHVMQKIASTPLLHYIQEAYKPQNNSLQASNTVSMNTSFFLQAEGHSADSTGDQSPIHRYSSSSDETDKQSDSDSSTTHHKHPNLGKAPSKNKDHKSKSDVKSPATVQVASNNGRKCYICNDPNHLANACPQKGEHKKNAKAKLNGNKSLFDFIQVIFPIA